MLGMPTPLFRAGLTRRRGALGYRPPVRANRLGRPGTAAVVVAALGLWAVVTWTAAAAVGFSGHKTSTWARWDTGHYVDIAEDGYTVGPCVDVANRRPTDLCGTTGWFPALPYLMRAAGVIGVAAKTAGRWIALAAFAGTLAVLWRGFLAQRPRPQGLAAMALAAVFPGAVYYGAIFPTSLATLSTVGCLALVERRRWAAAGLCGALAAAAYPSGLLVVVVAVVPLVSRDLGPWRERLRAAAWLVGPPMAAYGLVLLELQRTVGAWDAWFRVQVGYRHDPAWPWATVADQVRTLGADGAPGWIGLQTLLVAALVLAAGVAAARHWPDLGLGERAAVPLVAVLWLSPLALGGTLSLYRAEALVLPAVILVARLRVGWIVAAVVVAAPTAHMMARLFVDTTLQ